MMGRFLLVVIAVLVLHRIAAADQCTIDSGSWAPGNVNVYIHYNSNVNSGPGMGLRYALNMSEADVEFAVMRTINILNEEVGGAIKLHYAGTIPSKTFGPNRIVLYSNSHDCSDTSSGDLNADAVTHRIRDALGTAASIGFYRNIGDSCTPDPWSLDEADDRDFAGVLIHELGHGFYNVTDLDVDGCSQWTGEPTMMGGLTGFPPRHRVIKDWDRWTFQVNHGSRAPIGEMRKNYRNLAGWGNPIGAPDSVGEGFLYRPGSVGEASVRNIGYLQYNSSTPLKYGVGRPKNARYDFGGWAAQDLSVSNNLFRPVATASKPAANIVLVAYMKNVNAPGSADADIGYVCWRISNNTGVTFGPENCQSTWLAYRNGLTAQYSAQSDQMYLGFVGVNNVATFGVLTPSGSVLGSFVMPVADNNGNSSNAKSWHAPAMACKLNGSDAFPCRIGLEDMSNAGCLRTIDFGGFKFKDLGGGLTIHFPSFATTSMVQPNVCFVLYDTPGLVFDPGYTSFVLAVTSNHDAIYSYLAPFGSDNWTGWGDAWNYPGSFVSTAVLGYRTNKGLTQAWFLNFPTGVVTP